MKKLRLQKVMIMKSPHIFSDSAKKKIEAKFVSFQ